MSSATYCGGDVIGALVFDVGNRSVRLGYAMNELPTADVPTVVGMSVADVVEETVAGSRPAPGGSKRDTKHYMGVTSLCVPRAGTYVDTLRPTILLSVEVGRGGIKVKV